jgi:predicted O-methyltransferase YrrM
MEHFWNTVGKEDWFDFQELYSSMVRHCADDAFFVEVGSFEGRSAAYMGVEIINSNKAIKFDCVDTWMGSEEHEGMYVGENIKRDADYLFNEFRKNTIPISHIMEPIRTSSLEASQLYRDRSLDFVFLDAAHDYENVKNDILSWLPKVKVGGWIAGHDYFLEHFGVKEAVDEIFESHLVELRGSCWVYRK